MLGIGIMVFAVVFAIVLLVFRMAGGEGGKDRKLVRERLESLNRLARRGVIDEGLGILRHEMLSSIPALNRWLIELNLFPRLRTLLTQAGVQWTLEVLAFSSLGAGLAGGGIAYWRTGAWPFGVGLGLLAAGGPIGYVFFKRMERFGKFEELLPQALDLMVNALRAGHSLISAIEMAGREIPSPVGEEFKKTFDEQNFGLDLREALNNLALRVPLDDVHIVVTALLIQKETGGNLAEILDKVAYVIRERFRLKRQVRVYTAQGRLTGWILSLLPPILGAALFAVHPEHMSKLWTHPTGIKMLYASVVMTLIGGLIIRKIVRIRV